MTGRNVLAVLLMSGFVSTVACGSRQDAPRSRTEPGVVIARVNLRSGPTTDFSVLTVLDKGTEIHIETRLGGWMLVQVGHEVGYVSGRYVRPLTISDFDPAVPTDNSRVEILLPAHRRLLKETGWLEYVESNIDALQYYPWQAFNSSVGPAVGLSTYQNGRRTAWIATKDRDDLSIAATIVHEAGHLAGIRQIGTVYSEDVAKAVEAQFMREANARSTHPDPDSQTLGEEGRR